MKDFNSLEGLEEYLNKMKKELKSLRNSIVGRIEKTEETETDEFAQIGDEYYAINDFGIINCWNYREEEADFDAFEIGNAFKTWEKAEFELERRKVIAELKKYSKTYNPKKNNFSICYSYDADDFGIYLEPNGEPEIGAYYFESEKIAQKAIKEVGEERIKKYLFGVEE